MAPVVEFVEDLFDAAVDIVEDVVGAVGDAINWVVDEVVSPVVNAVGDVIDYALDNPIEAIATLATTIAAPYAAPFLAGATGTSVAAATVALQGAAKWVIPLASGTQTLVNGGSLEDAVKSAAISFAGNYAGKVAGTYINPTVENLTSKAISNTKLASTVANVLGEGTKSAAKTFARTGDIKAAGKAFVQSSALGGVSAGLEAATDAVMGNIDDALQKTGFGKEFNDLASGVKDSIYTSVAAEITGQDLSAQQIVNALDSEGFVTNLIDKYVPVASFMDGFIEDAKSRLGENLTDTQIQLLSDAVSSSWEKAKEGNPDLSGEAFFGSLQEDAYEELIDTISDPIDAALDSITGNAANAEAAAAPLNEAIRKSAEATENYNTLSANWNSRVAEQQRLKEVYEAAKAKYDANPTQANVEVLNAAIGNLNAATIELKEDRPGIQAQLDAYQAEYDKYYPTIEGLQEEYDEKSQYLMSDIEDLDASLKPMLTGVDRIVATTLRPGIDEDGYREAMGLGPDEDVWGHYLENQKLADNIIAKDIAAGYVNMANNDVSADSLPNIPSAETRPTTYGAPEQLSLPDVPNAPSVDFTAPARPSVYSGRGGDPRDYGLTPEDITKWMKGDGLTNDAYRNFVAGGAEVVGYTLYGGALAADEVMENLVDAFNVDYEDAEAIFYNSLAVQYDPNLTPEEKDKALADNMAAYVAAKEKIEAEQGSNITYFTDRVDPLKEAIFGFKEEQEGKISPEMQNRQYNALPHPDTTWEQILTGKAKDRLGRPYGLGDPLATIMTGVQELPDLAVDALLLAVTKNPAVLGGTVAATSMAEAGGAAAEEIEEALINARTSGELQKTQEFADLVRVYGGDEDAAFTKLIDQSMKYAAASGVVGGFGDVILGKIAGASGGAKLLENVPTGMKTITKIGAGGMAGGITEALEQVPVNMAQIEAGLDVSLNTDTGVSFLQGVTGDGTAGTVAASITAVKDTLSKIKDGTYQYILPDGTAVAPEPPSGDQTPEINTIIDNLGRFELYTNMLNDLSSWGAIPSDPSQFSAPELVSTLENLGIEDTTFIQGVANTAYNDQVVTKYEVDTALGNVQPDFEFDDAAYAALTGVRPDADVAAEVAAYVDPLYIDAEEVKEAAASEGIELTDEQIDAIVGQKDEEAARQEIDQNNTSEAEVRQFFADLGYEPTDYEVQQYVGSISEADQKTAIGNYVDPRQVTEDEARQFFADQGYTPTDEEVAELVGQSKKSFGISGRNYESNVGAGVPRYVDPRQVTEAEARQFFADQGYTPTDEEVANYVGQGGANFESNKKDATALYVDPRQVTDEEARQFFADLGYTPTDQEVADFVAQVAESEQQTAISDYVDPRFVTQAEVQAIADQEGLTLTEALAATYLGQKDQESTLAAARTEFDPLATTTAEAKQFFEDQGFTPTDQQVANFVASKTEEEQKAAIAEFIDPRQVTTDEAKALFDALGYTATDAEVASFVGQGGADFATTTETGVGAYVDPRQVTAEEARQFFTDLGYEPTDAQVAEFVAQVAETDQAAAIASYVDPRQVTLAEVQAIATEEGLTLTDALAATYVSQGVAANYQTEKLSEARAEYDPLATTLEEATQFFADTGYTATPEEIAQFVASKTEETQTSAIGAYVDPRQVTAAEAEEFLSAIGYQPSQADIDQFTGQLNDDNYQVTQKTAIDAYVDPRFFDAGEVRAAYEELGLVGVGQEDVDRFVGQFDPESEDYDPAGFEAYQRAQLETYMPTATFNLISQTIGSPAVEDDPNTPEDESKDATGIYKAIQEGSDKDAALEAAIDELSTDLGLTEEAILAQLGVTKEELKSDIGAVAEDVAEVKEDVAGVAEDVGDLADIIGTPAIEDDPNTDVDESQPATGLMGDIAELEAAGDTRDEAIAKLAEDLGVAYEDLAGAIGKPAVADNPDTADIDESQPATGIYAALGDVETNLSTEIGDVETRLTELIETNDGDVDAALEELATALGTTETNILAEIGTTKDALTESFTAAIGDVEANLGADIDAVANLVGKPAREVTQADVDFVVDLIAQENVSQELVTQYDVTGDGIIDINDQTLLETALQGDQDVTLADTSIFQPSTGIYSEIDTQTDAITDMINNLTTQITTQQQQENLRDLLSMEQAGLFKGAKTTVSSADPMNIDYLYDFSSIFANPSQQGLFASPYSTTTRNKAANQPMGPMPTASGFAKGGQVEDENDMLLRILGDM